SALHPKRRPIPGGVFMCSSFRDASSPDPESCISQFGGPYHLEPLEHRLDPVMHPKAFRPGAPAEEAPMRGKPPVAGALAFAFVPGELLIDRIQGADADVGGAPDRARLVAAVDQNDKPADNRRSLAIRSELPNQSRGSPLDPGD